MSEICPDARIIQASRKRIRLAFPHLPDDRITCKGLLQQMENSTGLQIVIILLLILANGLFAMSEIAIVSARRPRLQQWAEKGDKRAAKALALAENPQDFLSTVQIGITLIGILAGAYGGATLAGNLAAVLETLGFPARYSGLVSIAVVVSIITYLSLVIGELVPKNLALQNAERVAMFVAPFMQRLSRIVYPLVRLLSLSTRSVMRLLGIKPSADPSISDEEITIMIEQGAEAGLFEPEESDIVKRVFRLGDRMVSSLMTPRREIVWLDRNDSLEEVRERISGKDFSRFPVAVDDLDQVIGVVEVKDLLRQSLSGAEFDPFALLHPPLYVPESMLAVNLLTRFRETHSHMALVFDEYGGVEGLVTTNDLLEAIVGDIDAPDTLITQREDGSWLVDGMLPIMELLELLERDDFQAAEGSFQTVGGFVVSVLGGIPAEGQSFAVEGLRFEVVDMDRLRVDKVLVSEL